MRRTAATASTSTSSSRDSRRGEERSFELGGLCSSRRDLARRPLDRRRTGRRAAAATRTCSCSASRRGEVVHVTPHEGQAEYLDPVWLADSSGFLLRDERGPRHVRDRALHARRRLGGRRRVGVGPGLLRRRGRAAPARRRERGRLLAARRASIRFAGATGSLPSSVVDPVFSPDGSLLAFGFSTPTEPHEV